MVKRDKNDIDISVGELYLMWIGGCRTFLLVVEAINFFFGGK